VSDLEKYIDEVLDLFPYEGSKRAPWEILQDLGAPHWIAEHRQPSHGALDISRTADKLGIPFDYDLNFANAKIDGLGHDPGPVVIHLNPQKPLNSHRLSFAHELGHYIIEKVTEYHFHRLHDHEIENLVEFFGRQMVLPEDAYEQFGDADEELILQLSNDFEIAVDTVILQLMFSSKLPSKIGIDTTIPYRAGRRAELNNTVGRTYKCFDCENGGQCEPTDGVKILDFKSRDDLWDQLSGHREENPARLWQR
jgi:Zn-dependent peptidase ImmA (M78 family)